MRNTIELLTLLLTGGFALFALLNPYRIDNRITRAGKVAAIGCVVGIVFTIIGFAFRLRDAHNAEMAASAQLQSQLNRHEQLLNRLSAMSYPLSECRVRARFRLDRTAATHPELMKFLTDAVSKGRAFDTSDRIAYYGNREPEPFSGYSAIPRIMIAVSPGALSFPDFDFIRDARLKNLLIASQDQLEEFSVTYIKATETLEVILRFRPIIVSDTSGITSLADISHDAFVAVSLGTEPITTFPDWQVESFELASPAGLTRSYTIAQSSVQRGYPHLSHLLVQSK